MVVEFNHTLLSCEDVDYHVRVLEIFPSFIPVSVSSRGTALMEYRVHAGTMSSHMEHLWAKKWDLLCENIITRGKGTVKPWRLIPHARFCLDVQIDSLRYLSQMLSSIDASASSGKYNCKASLRNAIERTTSLLPQIRPNMTDIEFHERAYQESLRFHVPERRILAVLLDEKEKTTKVRKSWNPLGFFQEIQLYSFHKKIC